MACESCGDKPKKCNKDFTRTVVEIDNPEQITLMRKVTIPASMGDDTTVPPVVGKYKNVLLFYEANSKSYLYSSDGIPTLLANGLTDYEQAVNLPQINGVTLIGNRTSGQLGLQPTLSVAPGTGIKLENSELSGLPATDTTIGMVKLGDGLEVDTSGTMSISDIEQYAHFFDTVADMEAATNLVAGDYARTLGYYAKNDDGGAYYKISSTQPSGHYEILTSGLYAELIIEDTIKLSQLGAKNDGTDSSSVLVSALSYYDKVCIDKNYTFATPVTISSNGKEIYGLSQNINWSGTGDFITISDSNNFYLHNLTITCSSNNAINFAGTSGGGGCSDCNIENITIKNASKGIVSTYTWDTIFTNVRVQSSQKPIELNSQTNAILFNSCKFVSFSSKITLINCEAIEFNCCDISNFSSNDEAVNIYQSSVMFINCYFENLGSYTRGVNIFVANSTSVITNLKIIGGVVSSTGLAIYPANAKITVDNTHRGECYIVPRNISSTATSNPAVDVAITELNFHTNANRYNSTIFFDGKNDVTLDQIGGGTFTQTFTNGQKELSHTDAGSAGFALTVEANSSYLLEMDVELPEGVTSLAFAQAVAPEGGYSQSVTPINNKLIVPFATKTNTTIYVRWNTTGTVKLGSLKLTKIL